MLHPQQVQTTPLYVPDLSEEVRPPTIDFVRDSVHKGQGREDPGRDVTRRYQGNPGTYGGGYGWGGPSYGGPGWGGWGGQGWGGQGFGGQWGGPGQQGFRPPEHHTKSAYFPDQYNEAPQKYESLRHSVVHEAEGKEPERSEHQGQRTMPVPGQGGPWGGYGGYGYGGYRGGYGGQGYGGYRGGYGGYGGQYRMPAPVQQAPRVQQVNMTYGGGYGAQYGGGYGGMTYGGYGGGYGGYGGGHPLNYQSYKK